MRGIAIVLGAALVVVQPYPAAAQQPNADFSVSGTSTIRGWTCSAKGVIAATGAQTATVTVQVKSFVCPNDEMTQHLLETMKADKFPEIVYRLEKYEAAGAQAQATGAMTINGVTQPLSFPVAMKESAQGVLVEGNTRLDMTKFGVDPPVVMLGMLKPTQHPTFILS